MGSRNDEIGTPDLGGSLSLTMRLADEPSHCVTPFRNAPLLLTDGVDQMGVSRNRG